MMHWDEQQLDDALREHLRRRLDGVAGRAEPHFRRRLALQRRWRARSAAVGAIAAMAACVALAWNLWPSGPAPRPGNGVVAVTHRPVEPVRVDQLTCWRTLDEGTVLLDDQTPMRRIRRQVLERYEWFDPQQQAVVEITVPREEVILVSMQPY